MPPRRPSSAKAIAPHSTADASLAPHSDDSTGDFRIVAIGASAGGLDAFRSVLGAVPSASGMAFILVQHLDPTHDSMLVELLTGKTPLIVLEAVDGMSIEPEHIYVIPPDAYLSVGGRALHISKPLVRRGARLPFDFLLNSLAQSYGARAICVVLSGTGADGSLGLKAISNAGGLVIAQDPEEATFDAMPRSAIATGLVDLVAQAAKIPAALSSVVAGAKAC
jgi:two-component system CheB/CheR fusion protein